ncbi:hypothetical protein GCM10010990_17010 [Croceicoccus mobilis]|uniref:Uncharacterized protein n=1 Tax=Croceicoccus mobilis TaxID=1703339 RepID=A0A916Z035_9SPHN|nr:hypothetical protein GCM10010990_17010 [Croceicoccus mobilis]
MPVGTLCASTVEEDTGEEDRASAAAIAAVAGADCFSFGFIVAIKRPHSEPRSNMVRQIRRSEQSERQAETRRFEPLSENY